MNAIERKIINDYHTKLDQEQEVIALSQRVAALFENVDPAIIPMHKAIKVGDFNVYRVSRCFSDGWVTVFEIGLGEGGTSAINLPSKKVIESFFSQKIC